MPSTTVGIVTQTVYSFAEIKCPPLKTPPNGNVSNNDLVVENIVTFICKSGYEVTGQPLLYGRYLSVCVGFLKTVVFIRPFEALLIHKKEKGKRWKNNFEQR